MYGDSMAKTTPANNLADIPNPDEDPISELSDIMKFDPVEAAIEQADAELQIDLENELMGALGDSDAETPTDKTQDYGLADIPGMEEPVKVADPVPVKPDSVPAAEEAAEPAIEEITSDASADEMDGAFDAVFEQSLEDPEAEHMPALGPQVPPELENQLNTLLAGLGTKEEGELEGATDGDASSEPEVADLLEPTADDPVIDAQNIQQDQEVDAVSEEVAVADEEIVAAVEETAPPAVEEEVVDQIPDDVLAEAGVAENASLEAFEEDAGLADPEEDASLESPEDEASLATPEESDPLQSLAGIAEDLDVQLADAGSADVADQAAAHEESHPEPVVEELNPAPLVETADIVDEAVPVDDDLDIPDVAFENEVPTPPDFEELDEEFSKAFNKLTEFDNVETEPVAETAETDLSGPVEEAVEEGGEPHLGEKLDDIFAEMTEKIGPGAAVGQAGAAGIQSADGAGPAWTGPSGDVDEPFMSSPPPPIGAEVDPIAAQVSEGGGAKRGILIGMIVGAIAIAGGIGAFALSFGSGDDTAAPAVVKADDGPVKVKPKDPGGKTVPNEDKKVYERVAGGEEAETPTQEKLISTEEEPVDVVQEQPVETAATETSEPRVVLPGPTDEAVEANPVGTENTAEPTAAETEPAATAKNDDRILPDVEDSNPPEAEEVIAIKPRRVKTLVVKPDGTLVPREEPAETVAGELRTAPVEEVKVSEAPAPQPEPKPEPAETTTEVAAVTETETTNASDRDVTFQAPAADEAVVVDGGAAADEEGIVVEGIPVPSPAPRAEFEAQRAAAAAEAERQQTAASEARATETNAETTTQVAAADPAPVAETNTEWWVQISSQPSREGAQASYAELSNRYGSIIGGRGVNIVRAEIAGKGTYYRVRIAGGSRNEAAQICSRLKSAGAGCFIAR